MTATDIARGYVYSICHDLHAAIPSSVMDVEVYVDDIELSVEGTMSQVRCNLVKASSMLFKGLQLKGLQVSAKTIILASTAAEARGLADTVCAETGIKVDAATSARDLGVDRYVNGRRSIRVAKQRIQKARDRADRIRVVRK